MTLQEAIKIIEQQTKYIIGNPLLLEAYDVIINEAKPVNQCDACCMSCELVAWDDSESEYGKRYVVFCPASRFKYIVEASTEHEAIEKFKSKEKDRYINHE